MLGIRNEGETSMKNKNTRGRIYESPMVAVMSFAEEDVIKTSSSEAGGGYNDGWEF